MHGIYYHLSWSNSKPCEVAPAQALRRATRALTHKVHPRETHAKADQSESMKLSNHIYCVEWGEGGHLGQWLSLVYL